MLGFGKAPFPIVQLLLFVLSTANAHGGGKLTVPMPATEKKVEQTASGVGGLPVVDVPIVQVQAVENTRREAVVVQGSVGRDVRDKKNKCVQASTQTLISNTHHATDQQPACFTLALALCRNIEHFVTGFRALAAGCENFADSLVDVRDRQAGSLARKRSLHDVVVKNRGSRTSVAKKQKTAV